MGIKEYLKENIVSWLFRLFFSLWYSVAGGLLVIAMVYLRWGRQLAYDSNLRYFFIYIAIAIGYALFVVALLVPEIPGHPTWPFQKREMLFGDNYDSAIDKSLQVLKEMFVMVKLVDKEKGVIKARGLGYDEYESFGAQIITIQLMQEADGMLKLIVNSRPSLSSPSYWLVSLLGLTIFMDWGINQRNVETFCELLSKKRLIEMRG